MVATLRRKQANNPPFILIRETQLAVKFFLVTTAYVVTGWLGLQIPFAGAHITLVWLPTGVAVAALFRWGSPIWPAVLVGAFLVNLVIGSDWTLATGIAIGNTLSPFLTVRWLKQANFHPSFDRREDITLFIGAASVGMLLSAAGGCASLYLADLLTPSALGPAALAWWMGDFVGVLLAAPLLLNLNHKNISRLGEHPIEGILWLLGSVLVIWFSFDHRLGSALPLSSLALPLFVWAALRFGITGAALAGLVFSVVAAWRTASGHGEFVNADPSTTSIFLWSYMATTVLTGLLITALQAERRRVEDSLRERESELRTIIDTEPECVSVLSQDCKVLKMNHAGLVLVGADAADQVLGTDICELILDQHREPHCALIKRVFEGETGSLEFQIQGLKGKRRWLDAHYAPMRDAQGAVTAALSVTRDISERKHSEMQLRVAAIAFESQEGMVITDANSVIVKVNRAFSQSTGYSAEEVVGKTPRLFQSGRHKPEFYAAMWESIHRTGGWQGEIWDRRKNGEVYPKWLTISAVKDEAGSVTHYVGAQYDITERKKAEEIIRELAFFDQLTGLPNRTLLLDRLRQALAASARDRSYGALLFIDLDKFKVLNDTLGHDMGDLLLRLVGERLSHCIREGDTGARVGGDEFVVMLTSLGSDADDARVSAVAVSEKVLTALNLPYQLGDVTHCCSASVGVTLFQGQQASIDDLLKQADLAMYHSKASGRNAVRFFNPSMKKNMTTPDCVSHPI